MNIEVPEARRTYDAFAATYDDFNHRYRYERWKGRLLACAEAAVLEGRRLLDLGCGTGLSSKRASRSPPATSHRRCWPSPAPRSASGQP